MTCLVSCGSTGEVKGGFLHLHLQSGAAKGAQNTPISYSVVFNMGSNIYEALQQLQWGGGEMCGRQGQLHANCGAAGKENVVTCMYFFTLAKGKGQLI